MSDGASRAFSSIMSSIDPAMVVVTAAMEDGERAGCLVGFHAQSSIGPERYCVWLSKANYTYRVAANSSHLGIHFLTADDRVLAERFGTLTGDATDKFADLELTSGAGGVPILQSCPHWLVVKRIATLDEGGDHVCMVTERVEAHSAGAFIPFRVSHAEEFTPGHESTARPLPPTERAG
jgi:flavin reductase (DIM6/NTAB) family NADH-FMN oxidoreductase RutF